MAVSTSSFDIGAYSHTGRKRTENQDRFERAEKWFNRKDLRDTYGRLYIVADGVGGNAAGADASAIVVNQVMHHFYHDPQAPIRAAQRLQYAIECANEDVHSEATLRECNMASTVVAVLIENQRLIVANVGDSSALLFRHGARPKKLTIDHLGTERDGGPALLQAMGDPEVSVTITPEEFYPGDIVVLCTDGLTDLVSQQEIGEIVSRMSANDATQKLVQLANERGGHDNITVLVVRHGHFRQPRLYLPWSKRGIFLVFGFVVIATILSILGWLQFGGPDDPPVQRSPTSAPLVVGSIESSTIAPGSPTATLDPTTPTSTPQPPTNTSQPTTPPTRIPPQPTNSQAPVSASATPVTEPSATLEPTIPPPTEEAPTATLIPTDTPLSLPRRFAAQVVRTFPDTGQSGEQQSCVSGQVRSGDDPVAGAVVYVNNGGPAASSPRGVTDGNGYYDICGLGDSNWSVVLTYIPAPNTLAGEVKAIVYVNGSHIQVAIVNFLER